VREAPLSLERAGGLATLFLDTPPKNQMDRAFFEELDRLVREVLPRLGVTGLVIRGRGRHFSSGADVAQLKQAADPVTEMERGFLGANASAMRTLEALPYPVVAAIDGACLGSGLELALSCHSRIATPSALLGLPELSFGLIPGCGGTIRLAELVGRGRAIELVLSGRFLSSDEALEAGLVDAVVPRAELQQAAERLIARMSASARGVA
jgi:enoyl-CoA hydratase